MKTPRWGETNIGRMPDVMSTPQPFQHKAKYDLPLRRLMYRTTVRGSVPV